MTETLSNKKEIQIQILHCARERVCVCARAFVTGVHIHILDGLIITLQSLIFDEIINKCIVCTI